MKRIMKSGDFCVLYESMGHSNGNAASIVGKEFMMSDGTVVKGSDFVDLVNGALAKFEMSYPYEYQFINRAVIIYLADAKVTETMCVDMNGTVYINLGFLYDPIPYGLGMDVKNVMNILYHESMHTLLDHISRTIKYNEKGTTNPLSWPEMNIAGDLEINAAMVADGVCSPNFWDTLKGCYEKDLTGMPMEMIATKYRSVIEKYKGRKTNLPKIMVDGPDEEPPKDNKKPPIVFIDSTEDFRDGHADAMEECNKILTKAYKDFNTDSGDPEKTIAALEDALSKIRALGHRTSRVTESVAAGPMPKPITEDDCQTYVQGWDSAIEQNMEQIVGMIDTIVALKAGTNPGPQGPQPPQPPLPPQEMPILHTGEERLKLPEIINKNKKQPPIPPPPVPPEPPQPPQPPQPKKQKKGAGKGPGGDGPVKVERSDGKGRIVGGILKSSEIAKELKSSLEASGFDENEVNDAMSSAEAAPGVGRSRIEEVRKNILKNPKMRNTSIGKLIGELNLDEAVANTLWQEVLKTFLERTTLHAGASSDVMDRRKIRWGDRRTLGHDIMRPYHPKGAGAPQYINVMVDVSDSIEMDTVRAFAATLISMCKRLEFSGIWLFPWASKVDPDGGLFIAPGEDLQWDDFKKMVENKSVTGYGTDMTDTVRFMVEGWRENPTDVFIVITDGIIMGAESLKKLLGSSNSVLFIIYLEGVRNELKTNPFLKWATNPAYDKLNRVFIELKEQK